MLTPSDQQIALLGISMFKICCVIEVPLLFSCDSSFEKGCMKNSTQLISIASSVIAISQKKSGRHR